MKQPEAKIKDKILDYLKTVPNCSFEKRHATQYGTTGQPDISANIAKPGATLGARFEIEVKVPRANAGGAAMIAYWPNECFAAVEHSKHSGEPISGYLPGTVPTELQIARLQDWERAGAIAFVAYSVVAVRSVVNSYLNGNIK